MTPRKKTTRVLTTAKAKDEYTCRCGNAILNFPVYVYELAKQGYIRLMCRECATNQRLP